MNNKAWIYKVFLLTFVLSCLFSIISNIISNSLSSIFLFIILILIIVIGIIFDMIGVAVLTSKEKTFLSIASQKIKGGKETIGLLKNSSKISSICNDVIGDICGIISGSIGAVLAISISNSTHINLSIISVILTAFISSFTVGGKAICKTIATKNSDKISFLVGKILANLKIKIK